MKDITVNASTKYYVKIRPSFDTLGQEIEKVFNGKKILIISDTNVFSLYGEIVKNQLTGFDVYTYVIEAGESSKNTQNYLKIIDFLAEQSFSRTDLVLALGGGVVGDLAGFSASTYMRGISFIQVPTTLLADVDSSVGGKTGVNLSQGKNLLGAFYQPKLVYISLSTLNTLPQQDIANGMGEIVKYAFLSTTVTQKMIKEKDYESLIYASLLIKADIVSRDEFEGGVRATLNLGHTVCHAIENLSNYSIPHGICVAKGISKIIKASQKYYTLSEDTVKTFNELLSSYDFDLDAKYTDKQIVSKIKNDKKAEGDCVKAVLIKDVGDVRIVKMKIDELGELIK